MTLLGSRRERSRLIFNLALAVVVATGRAFLFYGATEVTDFPSVLRCLSERGPTKSVPDEVFCSLCLAASVLQRYLRRQGFDDLKKNSST